MRLYYGMLMEGFIGFGFSGSPRPKMDSRMLPQPLPGSWRS